MKFWPFKATFDNFLVEKWPFLGSLCNISTCRSLILKNKHIPNNWILLNKNTKNGHFSTKNGPNISLNSQKFQFYFIDPIRLCLKSIQLIGMCLFFYIKEIRVNLLNKNSKNGHFSTKKWPKNGP